MLIMSVNYPCGPSRELFNYCPLVNTSTVISCPYLSFIPQHETDMQHGRAEVWDCLSSWNSSFCVGGAPPCQHLPTCWCFCNVAWPLTSVSFIVFGLTLRVRSTSSEGRSHTWRRRSANMEREEVRISGSHSNCCANLHIHKSDLNSFVENNKRDIERFAPWLFSHLRTPGQSAWRGRGCRIVSFGKLQKLSCAASQFRLRNGVREKVSHGVRPSDEACTVDALKSGTCFFGLLKEASWQINFSDASALITDCWELRGVCVEPFSSHHNLLSVDVFMHLRWSGRSLN